MSPGAAQPTSVLVVGGTGLIGPGVAWALLHHGIPDGVGEIPEGMLELRRRVGHGVEVAWARPDDVVVVSRSPAPPGRLPGGVIHLQMDRRDLLAELEKTDGPIRGASGLLETHPEVAHPSRRRWALLDVLGDDPGWLERVMETGLFDRVVVVGSAAVFRARPGHPYQEHEPPDPPTRFMELKVRVEEVAARANQRGLPATVVRLTYPFGPWHPPLTPWGRDPGLLARLASREPMSWIARGELPPLQPIWVGDVARGLAHLLTSEPPSRPVYHLAGPTVMDWADYLAALARGTHPLDHVTYLPLRELTEAMGDEAVWLMDYLVRAPLLEPSFPIPRGAGCPGGPVPGGSPGRPASTHGERGT